MSLTGVCGMPGGTCERNGMKCVEELVGTSWTWHGVFA